MAKFNPGDIICHRQHKNKWLISRVNDGNYYLKGLDRRIYITVRQEDLQFFQIVIKAKKTGKVVYG